MRFIEIIIQRSNYVEPFDDYIGSSVCYDSRILSIRFKNRDITWNFGNDDIYPYVTPNMLTKEIVKMSQEDNFVISIDLAPSRDNRDKFVTIFRKEVETGDGNNN